MGSKYWLFCFDSWAKMGISKKIFTLNPTLLHSSRLKKGKKEREK